MDKIAQYYRNSIAHNRAFIAKWGNSNIARNPGVYTMLIKRERENTRLMDLLMKRRADMGRKI